MITAPKAGSEETAENKGLASLDLISTPHPRSRVEKSSNTTAEKNASYDPNDASGIVLLEYAGKSTFKAAGLIQKRADPAAVLRKRDRGIIRINSTNY